MTPLPWTLFLQICLALFLLAILISLVISIARPPVAGPLGDTGPQGPQGPTGAMGPPGLGCTGPCCATEETR